MHVLTLDGRLPAQMREARAAGAERLLWRGLQQRRISTQLCEVSLGVLVSRQLQPGTFATRELL